MTDLCELLIRHGAAMAGEIPMKDCRILRAYKLRGLGFTPETAVIGILPYYTPACDGDRTVSAYAAAKDYHYLMKEKAPSIIGDALALHPGAHFAVFCDSSPIDETDAAARCGLGVIGRNRLLITEPFSSFVFIFELLTDLVTDAAAADPRSCEDCGACAAACPGFLAGKGECLSALTQKKGRLTPEEERQIRDGGSVWGCDRCQLVCPHTARARKAGTLFTQEPFFYQDVLLRPTETTVSDDEDFSARAYSWRGRDVILRNLRLTARENSPENVEKGDAEL